MPDTNSMHETAANAGSGAIVHQAQPVAGPLSSKELAQRAGMSLAWIKKHARALGGHIVEGSWQFPPEAASAAIERRRTTVSEKITYGPGPAAPIERERQVGERDAAVVELLERGSTVSEIVIATKIPIETAMRLRRSWIESKQDDVKLAAHSCGCGAASDPRTARCVDCYRRSRVLTTEQLELLAQAERK